MSDWLRAAFTSTTGWDHLETLVDLGRGRMAGTPEEREASEATRDALLDVGARNGRLEEFDIQGWERGESAVTHEATGTRHETVALPRSPSGSATGPLVDLGWGLPADYEDTDVDGAVVIASTNVPDGFGRIVHRIEKYLLAVEHGASAFVLRNHIPGVLPRSGTIRGMDGAAIGEIPTVCVSYELGQRLSRRFAGDPVTVDVDATIEPARSQNVVAELGPETDEKVVVSAHIDGHDVSESAGDNAVGTALVVQVAEALAAREDDLETRVEFVGFGAEEVGLLGSEHRARGEGTADLKVMVQNDGVARARNLRVNTNGFPELAAPARAVGESLDHPVGVYEDLTLGSDHWRFVERGLPAYSVASEDPNPTAERAFGSSSGIVITPADTLDKLDPRDLRHHAIIETELVVRLADPSFTVERRTPEAVTEQVEQEGKGHLRAALQIPEEGLW
jgi:Zn-dependent M28 family amino/carboxypeptidase